MTKVYFISGLAADSRIFRHIRLPEGFEAEFLEWIPPIGAESLHDYSLRLGEKIDLSEPFVLLGMSMGGMAAVELASRHNPLLTVLISSVPVAAQLPFYFHWAGRMNMQKWIPISIVKNAALTKRLFTAETPEDKRILKQIIHESDDGFVRWAMDAILNWNNESIPSPLVHIHGSRDEMLPVRFTRPTHILPGAGHLMVMNRASEINLILRDVLLPLRP